MIKLPPVLHPRLDRIHVEFNLPDSVVAKIGCGLMFVGAMFAGGTRMLSEKLQRDFETEVGGVLTQWMSLSIIAMLFVGYTVISAALLATRPNVTRTVWWILGSLTLILLMFACGLANLRPLISGTKSIM